MSGSIEKEMGKNIDDNNKKWLPYVRFVWENHMGNILKERWNPSKKSQTENGRLRLQSFDVRSVELTELWRM